MFPSLLFKASTNEFVKNAIQSKQYKFL